jgi:multiple sugar transport system permease protein
MAFLGEHYVRWNYLMAASMVFILPTVLLYFFAQKYFIEGVKTTGIKG